MNFEHVAPVARSGHVESSPSVLGQGVADVAPVAHRSGQEKASSAVNGTAGMAMALKPDTMQVAIRKVQHADGHAQQQALSSSHATSIQ